jgi:fatty acid-binding protein DegV
MNVTLDVASSGKFLVEMVQDPFYLTDSSFVLVSTGALVTFASAAIGSNKGFDDLYPKLLDLVSDTRKYLGRDRQILCWNRWLRWQKLRVLR